MNKKISNYGGYNDIKVIMDFTSIHNIQPYGKKFIIASPRTDEDIQKLEAKWGLRNEGDQLCGVYNIQYEGWKTIIVIFNMIHKQTITYGMLAHEALHVMDSIFENIGHIYEYDNNEVGAYLIEWIVNIIFKHFKDHQIFKELTFETKIK